MFILATAGHVDHGKSELVRALTGMDPDRLTEEKERGMTIDLGFAWLNLPSGREVSIIDVPGHIHFIKNMLAGVGAVDLVLLVIAANEGIMPQTREHLAILDLLSVNKGIVVVSKTDLVDREWLEMVSLEVRETIKGTVMANAPIIPVSALTREGIPNLISTIDAELNQIQPKRNIGRPRIPIDRIFTISGFGTVVTGTLLDGVLSVGQEVEILPPSITARIKGLQTHKHKIILAAPGNRVAVNLSGPSVQELKRGYVLTKSGWLKPTLSIDVQLRLLPSLQKSLEHNTGVIFYTGTSAVESRLRLLNRQKLGPGEQAWAQFNFSVPIVITRGDLFIIRSSIETLGGGGVIEPNARRYRRFYSPAIHDLALKMKGDAAEIISYVLKLKEAVQVGWLISYYGLTPEAVQEAVETLLEQKSIIAIASEDINSESLLFSPRGWSNLKERALKAVKDYHCQYPLRYNMPKEILRGKLKITSETFNYLLQELKQEGDLVEEGLGLRLADYQVRLTPEQKKRVEIFLQQLIKTPFSVPRESFPEPELLDLLIKQDKIIRAGENVFLAYPVYNEIVAKIKSHILAQGKITLAEVRDLFETSRKYAQAILEYMDERHITRRVGEERVLY